MLSSKKKQKPFYFGNLGNELYMNIITRESAKNDNVRLSAENKNCLALLL